MQALLESSEATPSLAALPRESGIFPATNHRSLSEQMWGIRWDELVPCEVSRGIQAVRSSFDRTMAFAAQHHAEIFEADSADLRFCPDPLTEAKRQYYLQISDCFEFVEAGVTVGFIIYTPSDWSTYYIRGSGALPSHQGRQLVSKFTARLYEPLRQAGVQRIETDTSPSNLAVIHLLTRNRYNPTGVVLTDRWGANVKFTKFLVSPAESRFLEQYCTGIDYQRRDDGEPEQ